MTGNTPQKMLDRMSDSTASSSNTNNDLNQVGMAKDEHEFVSVAKISQATVARYVELLIESEGLEPENKLVREHPYMQYEIDVLSELIEFVENMGRISSDSVLAGVMINKGL